MRELSIARTATQRQTQETHPSVSTILMNKDLTVARFYFRVGYQGGEATLIKGTIGWTIKESKATWIE